MRTEKKSSIKNSATRLILIGLLVLIQTGWMIFLMMKLNTYSTAITLLLTFIAMFIALKIFGTHVNAAQKMPWLIVITAVPFFGICIYLLFGRSIVTKGVRRSFNNIETNVLTLLKQDNDIIDDIASKDKGVANQCRYISNTARYPVYSNTDVKYYPTTDVSFEAQLVELEKAEHFIFMEYHAIEDAESFARLKHILENKAQSGVEVRIFYDDLGSIFFLNKEFIKQMRQKGIQCRVFNPLKVIVNMFMNNRDHRKIVVIDGHTAFTGGVNLADEYINRKVRFGHWKDTAIMLKGDAVQSFTMMFLQMWNVTERQPEDYGKYAVPKDYEHPQSSDHSGFVLPYGDSPMDREQVGERVYLDILNQARSYVHIMTPYLILDDEMVNALSYAAKRGIDVKLIMPHIPDKKYAYMLARTFYPELTRAGVKIYEYTPGFVHAKVFVSDDEKAVVGTINLDFRSLYLHFECAAYIYRNPVVFDVERDFEETLKKCSLITMEDCKNYSWMGKKLGRLMRLIAPLM